MSAGHRSSITIVVLDFGVRIVKVCTCMFVRVVKHAPSCIAIPYVCTCVFICTRLCMYIICLNKCLWHRIVQIILVCLVDYFISKVALTAPLLFFVQNALAVSRPRVVYMVTVLMAVTALVW